MKRSMAIAAAVLTATVSIQSLVAADSITVPEQFHYAWHLRGGLAWLAGFRFPTSGFGEMKNNPTPNGMSSQLVITPARGENGFYIYRSEIDLDGARTLTSFHGYQWGEKSRKENTFFDYVKRLARIRKETPDEVENKVRPIASSTIRDVLTGIYYLRANSDTIKAPFLSEIYSDGKVYPVLFKPEGMETLEVQNRKIPTRAFLITAAPGEATRWPGGVKVWLSTDERKIPVRIEIQQRFASLRLDLRSIE
ncbi:MAG: DUF3108 domain-containing protein [Acidobacteriota bacterium]